LTFTRPEELAGEREIAESCRETHTRDAPAHGQLDAVEQGL
jgi:hypothetical protein